LSEKKIILLPDDKADEVILELIGGAKLEVLCSLYSLDCSGRGNRYIGKKLVNSLISADERGVSVNVLLNKTFWGGRVVERQNFAAREICKRNIDVRYLTGGRVNHGKFFLIDGKKAVIGSHNWTFESMRRNSELSVFIEDEALGKEIRTYFFNQRKFTESWRKEIGERTRRLSRHKKLKRT